jgi:hypothetical protein
MRLSIVHHGIQQAIFPHPTTVSLIDEHRQVIVHAIVCPPQRDDLGPRRREVLQVFEQYARCVDSLHRIRRYHDMVSFGPRWLLGDGLDSRIDLGLYTVFSPLARRGIEPRHISTTWLELWEVITGTICPGAMF